MISNKKGISDMWVVWILVTSVIAIIFVVIFISEFFQTIQPAHKGIVIKWGALQENVLNDWFYFKTPFWTEIVPVYVGQVSTDESKNVQSFRGIEPLSKDWQKMNIDAQIEYVITNPIIFRKTTWATEPRVIESLVLIPQVRRLLYDYTAEYTWKSLIQGWERQELGQRIFNTLTSWEVTKRVCKDEQIITDEKTGVETIKLAWCEIIDNGVIEASTTKWISITSVNLRKVKPNDKIIQAVENAQLKEQEVLVAKQEAEIEVQKANKVIETKRGQTESAKLVAEVEAYKVRVQLEEKAEWIKAEALALIEQAKAQKALKEALAGSKDLIEYKRIEVEMKLAEAQVEYAKNYTWQVPNTITVIGTEEAEWMSIVMGAGVIPTVSVK